MLVATIIITQVKGGVQISCETQGVSSQAEIAAFDTFIEGGRKAMAERSVEMETLKDERSQSAIRNQ